MDICIPELISPDDYDCKSAKLEASLSWLLTKAGVNLRSESGICADEYSSLLTTSVVNGLASGLFYYRAMCTLFPRDKQFFDQSQLSIVRWLLRQGFEVLPDEIHFEVLKKTDPFNQEMHLILIDKIMAAFIYQTLSIENVVKAVRRFSTFSASSELPSTIEETIAFWSNKVCQSVCEKYQMFLVSESRKEYTNEENNSFYNLLAITELEDLTCGRSLACLLSFYKPDIMVFEDICLDENSGIADSLYNLQLCAEALSKIFNFPASASPAQILHLTVTDVFYAHVHLTVNLMALFADLFEHFELTIDPSLPLNTVNNNGDQKANGRNAVPIKIPQISDVTKRSFYGIPSNGDKVVCVTRTSTLLPLRKEENQRTEPCNENGRSQDMELCQSKKMMCIDVNENIKHDLCSTSDDAVSIRDASSVGVSSSSSREVIGNLYSTPDNVFSSPSTRDTFMRIGDSTPQSENSHGEECIHDIYRVQSPLSFALKSNSNSQPSLLFSPYKSNIDPVARLRNSTYGVKQPRNDRHIKYCHDLGLISGVSKYRRQSAGTVKQECMHNNIKELVEDEADDEVSAITGIIQATDEEKFATPPEDFEDHRDGYHVQDICFNNSNSNVGKRNGTHIKGVRKDLSSKSNHEPNNHFAKTSWAKQKKLATMKDEVAGAASPMNRETRKMGTFRVAKGNKDNELSAAAPYEDNKTSNKPVSSPQKSSFSLLNQRQAMTQNGKAEAKKIPHATSHSLSVSTSSSQTPSLADGKTTWFHSLSNSAPHKDASGTKDDIGISQFKSTPSKLGFVKMELMEKRKQIEGKKMSSEMLWSKQRQMVGSEAFIQIVKGHKQGKLGDKDFTPAMEQNARSETFGLQSFEIPFETKMKDAESQSEGNVKAPEKHPQWKEEAEEDSPTLQYQGNSNSFGKMKDSGEISPENKERTLKYMDNLDAVQTIDHLTHSLSELKGEVKRLSLEQDQLKGFVSISQTPVTRSFKKIRSPQIHHKEGAGLNQISKTKTYTSPMKFPDSIQHMSPCSKPHSDEILTKPMATSSISAMKNMPYQQLPSYGYSQHLLSDNRLIGVGGSGVSCTPPLYNVFTTLPNKRVHRPLSSDSKCIIQGCPTSGELPYEYSNEIIGPYQHPLMAFPHPYGSPQSSPHPNYRFHMREPIGGHDGIRHHASSIAFTIPNESPDALQHHNIFPDWVSSSHSTGYPNSYPLGDRDSPCFGINVTPVSMFPPMGPGALHFQDPIQNIGHQGSPHFAPINLRAKSQEIGQESLNPSMAIGRHLAARSHLEMEQRFSQGGNVMAQECSFVTDLGGIKGDKNPHEEIHKGSAMSIEEQDRSSLNIKNQSNRSDNNALLSSSETFNEIDGVADELQSEESKDELLPASQSVGNDTQRTFVKENPVAFVVQQSSDENVSPSELEKRKQKLEEMHARRKEELETKKLRLEREALLKKEMQRQKEEQAMQKRAEDKARREAIYQIYLQKKQEGFGDDDEGAKGEQAVAPRAFSSNPQIGSASAIKRQRSAKTVRHAGASSAAGEDKVKGKEQFPSDEVATPSPIARDNETPVSKASMTSNILSNGDGDKEGTKEYTGPKLFVKPCHKSNRNIIENAISHCCLAGTVNQDTKMKVLEVLKNSESKHFVILFRDVGMQYRGLYTYDFDSEIINKIQGIGPRTLTNKQIEKFYKYNSGSKNFSEVTSTKHLSATIDAITLYSAVWQRLKPSALAGSKRNLT